MIYLEDYLEMIEHLPQELRDRFTEMREMDLAVQNNVDSLDKKVKLFFSNAKKMKATEKEAEYRQILKDYYKTLEDADEKVHLANQIHELVERYLRKLDQELHKFKMELEADHRGITEILEKRSLELDQPQQNGAQKENRYSFGTARSTAYCGEKRRENSFVHIPEKRPCVEKQLNVPEPRPTSAGSGRITPSTVPTNTTNVAYNLGHIGAGGNAIAAAVSQAIAATQQMQQGRRTASLKASYEAINIGVHAHEFSIGKELAAIQEATKKHKSRKASTIVGPSTNAPTEAAPATSVRTPPPIEEVETVSEITATTTIDNSSDNPDWTYDPNEPRYCICNQVSYGYMVECDNENCPFEWFHFACVDIKAPPKGKWYCPQCTSSMKRRGVSLSKKSDAR